MCADLFRCLCFCICGPQNIGCGEHDLIEELISTHKAPFLWPGFSIRHPWIHEAELYEAVRSVSYRDASWVFCGSIHRRAGKGGSQLGAESTYALYFVWSVRLCGPSEADEHTAVTWRLAATHPVRIAPLRYIQPYLSSWFSLVPAQMLPTTCLLLPAVLNRWLGGVVAAAKICPVNKDTSNICFTFFNYLPVPWRWPIFSLIPVLTKAAQMVPCVLLFALAMHHGPGCHLYSFYLEHPEASTMDKTSVDGNARCPLLGECLTIYEVAFVYIRFGNDATCSRDERMLFTPCPLLANIPRSSRFTYPQT